MNFLPLAVHPCDRKTKGGCEQICSKDGKKFQCECKHPEFKLAKDRKDCIPVHPCDRPNKCKGRCNKKGSGFFCSCPPDHILQEDGSCKPSK